MHLLAVEQISHLPSLLLLASTATVFALGILMGAMLVAVLFLVIKAIHRRKGD